MLLACREKHLIGLSVMDEVVPPEVSVKSVSSSASKCEDIVLRESDQIRLVFRATLVDTPSEPDAGVSGALVYQRKTKEDTWEALENINFSGLKAGEHRSMKLSSEEILRLRDWLNNLQLIKDEFDLPSGETHFVGFQDVPHYSLAGGQLSTRTRVIMPEGVARGDAAKALRAILGHSNLDAVTSALRGMSSEDLLSINTNLGLSVLESLIAEWDKMSPNASEDDWQSLLARYPFALQQVFYTPAVFLDQKAYVGGKCFHDTGGSVVDFLLSGAGTSVAKVVEIKKSSTQLLSSSEYRNGVWNSSTELSGAIQQALVYRDRLFLEMRTIDQDNEMLHHAMPGCAVLIGNTDELDSVQKRQAFENARARHDVVVLTFDEMRHRLGALVQVMHSE